MGDQIYYFFKHYGNFLHALIYCDLAVVLTLIIINDKLNSLIKAKNSSVHE